MRVSERFEVKTKGITKAELDLSLNYTNYLRNGLIYGWGNYVFRAERRENKSICLFPTFPETLNDILNIRLFCGKLWDEKEGCPWTEITSCFTINTWMLLLTICVSRNVNQLAVCEARQHGHRYQHRTASSARQSLSPALQATWSNHLTLSCCLHH